MAWYVLMQQHHLTSIPVIYSVATLLMEAGLGVAVFQEPFTWREGGVWRRRCRRCWR